MRDEGCWTLRGTAQAQLLCVRRDCHRGSSHSARPCTRVCTGHATRAPTSSARSSCGACRGPRCACGTARHRCVLACDHAVGRHTPGSHARRTHARSRYACSVRGSATPGRVMGGGRAAPRPQSHWPLCSHAGCGRRVGAARLRAYRGSFGNAAATMAAAWGAVSMTVCASFSSELFAVSARFSLFVVMPPRASASPRAAQAGGARRQSCRSGAPRGARGGC